MTNMLLRPRFLRVIENLADMTNMSKDSVLAALQERMRLQVGDEIAQDDDLLNVALAWTCEQWRAERSQVSVRELWQVDQKFSHILSDFTMAQILQSLRFLDKDLIKQ